MAADDLSAPLGQGGPRQRRRWTLPVAPAKAAATVLGLFLTIFVAWAVVGNDPLGGEPGASVPLPPPGAAEPARAGAGQLPAPAAAPAANSGAVVTIIDGATGKRQDVQIGAGAGAAGDDVAPSGGDPKLLEVTRHGLIPKVAADGTRPMDAYARAAPPSALGAGAPRIAIVMSGLGVGARITAEAVAKLPGAVTLAFMPYGDDVVGLVGKARAAGHEVLLHLPMEPIDFPDNDPGPQALLTSLTAEQNTDRLYWLMSRFQGYVGVASYMGSRFSANEASFAPVLKDIARRGLIYFDDGSSSRSLAAQFAGANSLSFARADLAIDAVPTPAEIARALGKLESIARANGVAIGVASALPVTIDRVAQWARTAEGRGFLLVPISGAASRGKSS